MKHFCKIHFAILLISTVLLNGCGSRQEPAQTVINFTDNSQLVQVVGDNNNMAATTDVQTAIGGKKIKKKIPLKVHKYEVVNGKSVIVGEDYKMVEIEEETQPNPYLLKFLAENKLSENFGREKNDNSKEHDDIVNAMTEDEINAIKEYKK